MKNFFRRVCPMSIARTRRTFAIAAIATLAASPSRGLAAQSLEGSKWTVEQEGVETAVLWWLGGQGRVRIGEFGTILTGYSWRQAGDSVFVSVGDTVRYSALLMSNRLVGVRTGPRRQEGWWSGVRADGPTALAQGTPTTPPTAEPMSRPSDEAPAATPARGTEPAAQPGGRRPLRQIERAGANPPAAQPQGGNAPAGGREIRRIERTGNTPARATEGASVATAELAGQWVNVETDAAVRSMTIRENGTLDFVASSGTQYSGVWVTTTQLTRLTLSMGVGSLDFRAWRDGDALVLQALAARAGARELRFRHPSAQP
jgi:hypothetical protein